jgi:hypothetical protein
MFKGLKNRKVKNGKPNIKRLRKLDGTRNMYSWFAVHLEEVKEAILSPTMNPTNDHRGVNPRFKTYNKNWARSNLSIPILNEGMSEFLRCIFESVNYDPSFSGLMELFRCQCCED